MGSSRSVRILGIVVAAALLAGCGGGGGSATTEPPPVEIPPAGAGTTDDQPVSPSTVSQPVEVPVTYVVLPTVAHAGTVHDEGAAIGAIRFAVEETPDSSHETVAGGQIVVVGYQVVDLDVEVALTDGRCGDGVVSGSFTWRGAEPTRVDTFSFAVEEDGLTVQGRIDGRTAIGTLVATVAGPGGSECTIGPFDWTTVGT